MKRKKVYSTSLLSVVIILTTFSGCLYQDIKYPGIPFAVTQYQLSSKDFKILGPVAVEGVTTLWFGAVLTGGEGYSALLAEAKELGGDSIIDYMIESEYTSILFFIYAKAAWKASGKAIRYEDHLYENSGKN